MIIPSVGTDVITLINISKYYNMSFDPFILSETNDFLIIYKPPFYKVDIPNNYHQIKTYDDYKKLKNPKPLQLFIKFFRYCL